MAPWDTTPQNDRTAVIKKTQAIADPLPKDRARDLPDCAAANDTRGLAIQMVGISDLSYPIKVMDKTGDLQSTVGDFKLSVSLPADQKGTHMSRFLEVLNGVHGELTVRNLPEIIRQLQSRLGAQDAHVEVAFPYFVLKTAPKSGAQSLMDYQARFRASAHKDHFDFVLGVTVPVTTLCPCSKAISDFGAHNQRSYVDVEIRSTGFLWLEDLIEAIEGCASSPVFGLLKREDEKCVTETAYQNPCFVEDLVRDVVAVVRDLPGTTWIDARVSSIESIHNHSAFAHLEWTASDKGTKCFSDTQTAEQSQTELAQIRPSGFGEWLHSNRVARKLGQRELATRVGVSASYLSRVENNERGVSPDIAEKLALVLGVDPTEALCLAGHLPDAWIRRIQDRYQEFASWITA